MSLIALYNYHFEDIPHDIIEQIFNIIKYIPNDELIIKYKPYICINYNNAIKLYDLISDNEAPDNYKIIVFAQLYIQWLKYIGHENDIIIMYNNKQNKNKIFLSKDWS